MNLIKSALRTVIKILTQLGFDFKKIISLKFYPRFRQHKKEWISKGGVIHYNYMILDDFEDYAGVTKSEYFHQDLLVANYIYKNNPKRHVDIGSRIDGFVAHVASFRKIEVVDIRFLENSEHENIKFIQADLIKIDNLGEVDSISCLHVIEHFGLGRYGDAIDIDGHNKGIRNLVNLVSKNGYLYISFPIADEDQVYFNANRRFKFDTIFKHPSIKEFMKLIRFDFIDEFGNLHTDIKINDFDVNFNKKYGCGIYTFKKISD
jgi:hypothetical protein